MKTFNIKIAGRVASFLQREGSIICDNSDYTLAFTFDAEWDAHPTKTARFVWNGAYEDVEFTGTECPVPVIHDAKEVLVGVYAGDLKTTTEAVIPCRGSILSKGNTAQPEQAKEYRDEAFQAAERAEAAAETAARDAADAAVDAVADEVAGHVGALESLTSLLNKMTPSDYGKSLYANETGDGFMLLGNTRTEYWNLCDLAEEIVDNCYVNGGTTGGGDFKTFYYMPVKGGTAYYADGTSPHAYKMRFVNWYDANKTLLSVESAPTTPSVTAPTGACYCTASFIIGTVEKDYYFTAIAEEYKRVTRVVNDDIVVTKWNLLELAENCKTEVYVNEGKETSSPGFYTYFYIPIEGDTVYYHDCPEMASNYYGSRFVNYYDSNRTFLSTATYVNKTFTSPTGAKYCSITFLGKDPATEASYLTSIKDEAKRVDVIALADKSGQVKGYEAFKTWATAGFVQRKRKGVVNFQFDDGRDTDYLLKELFDAYGYKCAFAILSGVTGDALKTYRGWQDEGFEILSHSTDGLVMNPYTDYAATVAKMKNSRDTLIAKGFDIHGWVTPSSGLNADLYDALAELYDYGFGWVAGEDSPVVHYYGETPRIAQMARIGLESNPLDAIKNYIKTAYDTNGFISFYGHGYPDGTNTYYTENNLKAILEYCQEIGVKVTTPGLAVQDFFAFRYTDFLALKNNQ